MCLATKLVCALGPSCHSVEVLEEMLNAGMVGARIDLTWGGLDFHRDSLRALNVSNLAVQFMPNKKLHAADICLKLLDLMQRMTLHLHHPPRPFSFFCPFMLHFHSWHGALT